MSPHVEEQASVFCLPSLSLWHPHFFKLIVQDNFHEDSYSEKETQNMANGRDLHPEHVQTQPHKLQSENIIKAKLMVQEHSWNTVGYSARTASEMNFCASPPNIPF
jgi:hypothetical protein